MAETTYIPDLTAQRSTVGDLPRHSLIVRITHWVFALSFIALWISGFGIILAHPHFYWGETGGVGEKPLFSLPLPTILGGGRGRYPHFEAAWFSVLAGLLYVVSGVASRHFRRDLLPEKTQRTWTTFRQEIRDHLRLRPAVNEQSYNLLQRLSYITVIFVMFPFMMLSGFAMSPSLTSVFPWLVTIFGGQQTARTLHFVVADLLLLFLIVHVAMVAISGFSRRMRAMITGHAEAKRGGSR